MFQANYRLINFFLILTLLMALTAFRAYGWMHTVWLLKVLLWCSISITLVLVGRACWRRRFGHAASVAAAPFALALIVVTAELLSISPLTIRFFLTKHEYAAEIPRTNDSSNVQIKVWPWNWYPDGFILGGQTFELLIYDSSGQITRRRRTQTADWDRSAKEAGYNVVDADGLAWLDITSLGGHFYIVAGGW